MTAEEARKEKAAGVRSTRQRAAIVETLRHASGFRTAQDLHADLAAAGHRVGLATVYRNLQALATAGELDVLHLAGEDLYRLCGSDEHHHHLVCRRCGLSIEITGAEIEDWASRQARAHGFAEVTHVAEIYGLCGGCRP